jgi:acetoin utilization deacetylase AcuC-like enzyme
MDLTVAGYAELMDVCLGIASGAAGGRCVVVLEGGYGLPALAQSGPTVMRALLGEPPPAVPPSTAPALLELVGRYRRALEPFWPVLAA